MGEGGRGNGYDSQLTCPMDEQASNRTDTGICGNYDFFEFITLTAWREITPRETVFDNS